MKRLFFILIAFAFSSQLFGQLQVGQGININANKAPEMHNMALIPLHSVTTLTMTANTSMDAFKRHPMGASLLCSGFLIDHLGGGLKVNYDKMGLSSQTDVELGLAYFVFLSKPTDEKKGGDKLSFSLTGNARLYRIDWNDVMVNNLNDPSLTGAVNYQPGGNASAGIAFLRENKYYGGISVQNIIPAKTDYRNSALENLQRRHYYLAAGYTFNLSKTKTFDLELHGIAATTDNLDYWQWQGGLEFRFLKMGSVGAGVMSNGSLKFDLGLTAGSWDFGYSCGVGVWTPGTANTYKAMNNAIFIRKVFNEGRRSRGNASSSW